MHALCIHVQLTEEGTPPLPATGKGPCLWARPREAQGGASCRAMFKQGGVLPDVGAVDGGQAQPGWARSSLRPQNGAAARSKFLMCLLGEGSI